MWKVAMDQRPAFQADGALLSPGNGARAGSRPRLTPRESGIMYLMSAGHSTPEIAKMLELRPRTVENHKRNIYEKLGVSSQSHAVALAISLGLLDLPQRKPDPGPDAPLG